MHSKMQEGNPLIFSSSPFAPGTKSGSRRRWGTATAAKRNNVLGCNT